MFVQSSQPLCEICLADVARVTAYKLDQITTDLVCLEILVNRKASHIIHEDIPGFDDAVALLQSLPGFDAHWRQKVVLPPFAANRMIVFEKR